ncbi:hypothetical protein NDU88_004821 [Pleurodeles waltl]|uniref:Uncharacterized protein n=1 Tax=Pleurodeles waltl TaxID=8319 RepID=A0AAV7RMC4_PLEWA|nr:hypothetical protein NDU88_004821 [Pleurodeles waltl]
MDPELSQLLRLVLEKLGSDDAVKVNGSPDKEVSGDRSNCPKWSHVAPSAAFPPVKRRRNGKTPVPASLNQSPSAVVSPPAQIALPEPPAPTTAPPTVPQALNEGTTTSPGLGLEKVLADIRKSLAALAPKTQSVVTPAPLPGVVLPAPPVPPPSQVPEHQAQVQDPSRQELLEVSKLLASINAPTINKPPPTTPWVSNDSLQNSLNDLKCQVDTLAAAHTSNPLQASVNSPSVTQTPGAVLASPPLVQNVLLSTSKVPGQDNPTKEGTTDALLSRPGGNPFLALAGGAGTLAVLMGASLEPLTPAVTAETTVAVNWVAEVLDWILATLARSGGVGNRSMVARKSFLGTLEPEEGEGLGVEEEGVVVGGVSLLCLGAGAWAGCCCEVDGCWVSDCLRLCTLGGGVTDTVGEDTGDVCMDVGVVTASEGRVVIGVLVMEVVDEDVVHAGVSGDATGSNVDEEEEGDTVEAVDVGVSASGWCLCECLWDEVWCLCLPDPLLCVDLGACRSEGVLGIGWG